MALILCPECRHQVSDKAISCPNCGYPMAAEKAETETSKPKLPKKTKRKYKKLPNGFGSIKKLTGKRRKPYAAYPTTKEFSLNGSPKTPPAIGYYEDWYSAFDALREYNRNPYDIKENLTFQEVYNLFYKAKFQNSKKQISKQSEIAYSTAFKNCSILHNMKFLSIKKQEMQEVIDHCPLGYSSVQNIKKLFCQMFKYAIENDITDKNYAQFVTINIEDDNEKGEPFSQEELDILWQHKEDNSIIQMILIMIYTGFRIKAFENIEIHLEERYLKGGVKTAAGKGRIVPIHDSIYEYVENFNPSTFHSQKFRIKQFYPELRRLNIATAVNGKKHTPHDCRHTFSWLCDKYKVDNLSKHLLMGHSLGKDVEQSVYGHRTLEELRIEIAKIHIYSVSN